ncbi:MAG TPA: radical SAM family heme chaperone HemW [Desulfosalsimonadaceae bacterium]|nr:radical SAM family heme chaperone HemW [Desulfosalsimonadaceae bacterium]
MEKTFSDTSESAGIYVHVPFCRRKCPYCDFYSITATDWIGAWLTALLGEIGMVREFSHPVDTVYIGGGTPSLLDGSQVRMLLDAIFGRFSVCRAPEITLEVNPGTVEKETLKRYRDSGVNRLNIGVQSFRDKALGFLGRIHTGRQAAKAIEDAQEAGFDNIGLDLIYALPGQSLSQWQKDLRQALAFSPAHLSCYLLTYAAGTEMAEKRSRGEVTPLSESACSELFLYTHDFLFSRGWRHYEIANFASREDLLSRHNSKYWRHAPYIGLGPAAHSYERGRRWWNPSSVARYVERVSAGRPPMEEEEALSREQEMIEAVYLGLRRDAGICIPSFDARFQSDFSALFKQVLPGLQSSGYLCFRDGRCALTREGMVYADGIARTLAEQI